MTYAVLLGNGRYEDEVVGFDAEGGPRKEFIEIAKATRADVYSYASSGRRHGNFFKRIFRAKPLYGSVVSFAMNAKNYQSCYATGEEIGLLAALILGFIRWPGEIVCVVHNVTPKKVKLLRLIGHKKFRKLIVVSRRQAELLRVECGIPDSKISFRYNWVDENFFKPHDGIRERFTYMACGAESRDYGTLISASNGGSYQVEIYAHGFFVEGDTTSSNTHPENVLMCPRVSFEDLSKAYGTCHAGVVPLKACDYAAGVTGLLEVMSSGKPVVVSSTVGITDYIDFIDQSCRVHPSDIDGMSTALSGMSSMEENERERIGKENRRFVVENCSLDSYVSYIRSVMVDEI